MLATYDVWDDEVWSLASVRGDRKFLFAQIAVIRIAHAWIATEKKNVILCF